ncbi:MAG: hypothetical protein COZ75_10180 [Flavobacteriaceae bacterium CG_4_8_14_3_um_filter_34_10]|nr:hypothetical protein [Flavobacteriia bacterium]OIP52647.1 MAG: hypothetical protein AUK33_00510 [Flavobacteriaceae bacterium CG2_30_34_30]PIQ16813.1 MAG: hypothetical protein COW66_14185 [Flavobacteriaceae bacterium CG18_big_fil_WC_8_21_14_2_50_34_36]PIV50716.1 MAG: hypothetical protein COS19_03490 [Flavobacteriaceae bacterium CG02_land_8_20_14_3_00_34_13]PIX08788.1 MAG: hypothetical protein COZ75_10180 [Flavobacteriaceae bacterium CG_4_8_14_3_um_filter_34_10]PJC07709.1 MAG: hypothetical pr
MKKVFSLLMVAMIFAACSSDDDNANVSLEGTWKMTAFKSENAYDVNGNGTISNDIMQQTNCYQNETVVFNANNTVAFVSTSYADIELVLVAGSTTDYEYNITCVNENDTTAGTWSQTNNTVIITDAFGVYTATQTGSTLTFVIPNGFPIEVTQGSGTATITEDLTITYEKQ